MKLSNIAATLGKNRVRIDVEDPIVNHAVKEVGTYVCDVLFQMGIRAYDPNIAMTIARQMLEVLGEDEAYWSRYMQTDAHKINEQFKTMLSTEGSAS